MNHWLEKLFMHAKVQRQLFNTFILAIGLPVLAIGFFLIFSAQNSLTNNYQEQANAENLRAKSILFDVTTNIYNVSEDFASDQGLQALAANYFEDQTALMKAVDGYQAITRVLSKDTSISTLLLYTDNESIGDFGSFRLMTDKLRQTDWYRRASTNAGIFWMTKTREDKYGNQYFELTMYRNIPLVSTGGFIILEIAVSDNYLKNRIDNNTLKSLASVNQDLLFYSTERSMKGLPIPAAIDYSTPYYRQQGRLTIENREYIGTVNTLQPYKSDDHIYIATFSKTALPYISRITVSYVILVLLALLFPCALLYAFTRYFSARVITLRSAMHQASSGDYNIIDSFHGSDELSEAFLDLQHMIDEIQKKDAQMYQAQIREQQIENRQQEIEYKMLASQINPHFLYNTLETIRMKAFTSGNKDVATAIKLLGKSLRYVLENTGTVSTTLDKELAYIDTYVAIQKLRFGGRVNYSLTVQEGLNLRRFHLLPLLLQPIVENAISHGLEGFESDGQILIHIDTQEDTFLCIEIGDNGVGMDEEELALVRENIRTRNTERTSSIGLYNINQRIQLCYGAEFGMEITSSRESGTRILLRLPLDKVMEEE